LTVTGSGSLVNTGDAMGIGVHTGSGTLNVLNGATVNSVRGTIGSDPGTLGVVNVSGAGSHWTNRSDINIGISGAGTLNIMNGGRVDNGDHGYFSVGGSTGAIGAVTVSGSGSILNVALDAYFGANGQGSLNIVNGGTVVDREGFVGFNPGPGSSGTVTIDGIGSSWVQTAAGDLAHPGYTGIGNGVVTVQNGGLLWSPGIVYVDSPTGALLTVTGSGSLVNSGDAMAIGVHNGSGTLNVWNGASVNSVRGTIGSDPGTLGVVNVSGAGSHWTNRSDITVGYSGSGILNILDGGRVDNGDHGYFSVGGSTGAIGAVTVSGSGSILNVALDAYFGANGQGSLNIMNGGTVVDREGFVGFSPGSSGTVTIDGIGSSWVQTAVPGDLAHPGYTGIGSGVVTVQNGGLLWSPSIVYVDSPAGALLTVTGSGSLVNSGDAMAVGVHTGSGTLNVLNGATVSSVRGSIGGDPGTLGVVNVSGAGSP
jgi:T5SS/PEP-CTERM-associated repeat protein